LNELQFAIPSLRSKNGMNGIWRKWSVKYQIFYRGWAQTPPQRLDKDGKMIIFPTQALETWQCPGFPADKAACVTNDTPTVAGLHSVLEKLLLLPDAVVPSGSTERDGWAAMLATVPVGRGFGHLTLPRASDSPLFFVFFHWPSFQPVSTSASPYQPEPARASVLSGGLGLLCYGCLCDTVRPFILPTLKRNVLTAPTYDHPMHHRLYR
jgi:hypothetical protein